MKFKATRERLLEACTAVQAAVPARSIKPVLQNLHVSVAADEAVLLGTDTEVAIRYRIPILDVAEAGEALLPATRMVALLRESPGEEVTLTAQEGNAEIRVGNAQFKVQAGTDDDFPPLFPFPEAQAFKLPREAFRTLIRKTAFAAAKERTRYALNGVRFDVVGGRARMVATDGKRLAIHTAPTEGEDREARIIPPKGLQLFERALREEDEEVEIALLERDAMLRTANAEVSTRLVEGLFPEFESVLPAETPYVARFGILALTQALRQASVLTTEESRSVKFSFEEDQLVITSRAVDVGESRIVLETEYDADPLQVSYNPDYLLEGLKILDVDEVTLKMSGHDTPTLLHGEENYTYLVMPVTLRTG